MSAREMRVEMMRTVAVTAVLASGLSLGIGVALVTLAGLIQ